MLMSKGVNSGKKTFNDFRVRKKADLDARLICLVDGDVVHYILVVRCNPL